MRQGRSNYPSACKMLQPLHRDVWDLSMLAKNFMGIEDLQAVE
jgi:hypothetical protein